MYVTFKHPCGITLTLAMGSS